MFVFDSIHQDFAKAGGDWPHRGVCSFGQRSANRRQALVHLLPSEVDVGVFFENCGDLAEAIARNRTGHLQSVDPGKSGLNGEGNLRLHL